jgi:hypothetical protein
MQDRDMEITKDKALDNKVYRHELNQRIYETQQYLKINGWEGAANEYFWHLCDLEESLIETHGHSWGQVEAEAMADEWTEGEAKELGDKAADYSAALILSLKDFVKQYS